VAMADQEASPPAEASNADAEPPMPVPVNAEAEPPASSSDAAADLGAEPSGSATADLPAEPSGGAVAEPKPAESNSEALDHGEQEVAEAGPSPAVIAALLKSVYEMASEAAVARASTEEAAPAEEAVVGPVSPAEAAPAEEAMMAQASTEEAPPATEEPASPSAFTGHPSFQSVTSYEEGSPGAITGQPSFQTYASFEEPSPTEYTAQPSSHTASYEETTPAPVTAEASLDASASIVEEDPTPLPSPTSYEDWLTAEASRDTRTTEPSTEESEMERTFYRSPEDEPPEPKKPKEIGWTHLSVASEDVLDSLETAVQYTSMARTLREKGLLGRGIRMMERALAIVERREMAHPALCLEAAKVRINYAAYLSEGFRHRQALQIIKEAQETLTKLLQWAVQCPPEDFAVQALGREARALHTAAIVAQAMAVEYCADDDDDLDTPEGPDEAAKETARVSAAGLAPDHPLAMLVRQNLGTAPRVMGGRRQSNLGTAVRKRVSNIPLQPLAPQRPSSAGLHKEGTEPTADMLQETPHQERSASRGSHRRSDYSASKAKPMGKEERMDVFKQYLRDREMARVAHLLALSDDWETQTRKKLFEVHKQTKFQLELVNVEELKEKRYTRVGHKVFMQNMKNSNKCWSNPDISREARKDKTAPEVCQLKKLSQKIYVKPPPAPPPPPPPKPKVDASLAGNMKMSMRRGSGED